jgi:hypothetical protein
LPVIALGLFDRDIGEWDSALEKVTTAHAPLLLDADSLMALPELYKVAKEGHWFGLRRFLFFMFQGAYQVRRALESRKVPYLNVVLRATPVRCCVLLHQLRIYHNYCED